LIVRRLPERPTPVDPVLLHRTVIDGAVSDRVVLEPILTDRRLIGMGYSLIGHGYFDRPAL
jgi:hypothetical protein